MDRSSREASQGRDRAALVAQDLASGRFDLLASSLESDVGGPVLDPVSCRPIAAPVIYGRRHWSAVDPSVESAGPRRKSSPQK